MNIDNKDVKVDASIYREKCILLAKYALFLYFTI